MSPAKYGSRDRGAVWVEDLGGPKKQLLDGVHIPLWEGAILRGGKGRPVVKYSDSLSCAVQNA